MASTIFIKDTKIYVTGRMLLLNEQTVGLVASQLKSLSLALAVITLLMVIQLRSLSLGLMSLIPNLFPLVSIFGLMGLFNIPLDSLTIFAAVISFGLSVDDSIHFLTHLKREIQNSNGKVDLLNCLKNAYATTSRALISTTAVLFLSSLALLFSPFRHVSSLGFLIASASLIALLGDLVVMPAVALKVKPLNRYLSEKIRNSK